MFGVGGVLILLSVLALLEFFSTDSSTESIEIVCDYDCELKQLQQRTHEILCEKKMRKEQILDNLTYSETVQYQAGKYTNEELKEINTYLEGQSVNCSGTTYDKINIKEILGLTVQKAHATEYSEITKGEWMGKIHHKGYSNMDVRQLYVNYAWHVSNGNKDFLATLEAENGLRDPYRQSNVPDAKGPNGREASYGFCQMHRRRHSDIVDDQRFRDDHFWQISQCWFKYNSGTKFYGYYARKPFESTFQIIE